MRPIFIVQLNNGKTDNVFEYDFNEGKFIGACGNYSYSDIKSFIGVPCEIISSMFLKKKTEKKSVSVVSEDNAE